MGIIATAISWALSIANDDSHGYDQTSRWGPDYDCSSLVIQAFENAGVPVKTNGASYTGNMVEVFKDCGFKDVTSSITLSSGSGLKKGDVLWVSGHTEMVSKPGYVVGAHINENGEITGGQTGDQTGNEISERTYYNYPWTTVLRYPEVSEVTKAEVTSANRYLTDAEMEKNARYIYQFFSKKGWTLNAIAGMLGNMHQESTLSPGIWQGLNQGNTSGGIGLVQWTPATNLINWATANGYSDYTDIDCQLAKIMDEFKNGGQYYPTDAYPLTFAEFSKSTKSPEYLASTFLKNYERAGTEMESDRQSYARRWYNFLLNYDSGESGDDYTGPYIPRKTHFKFFMIANRRRSQWRKTIF